MLVVLPPYRVEIALNLLVVLVIAGFFLFYSLVRLVGGAVQMPARVRQYRLARRRDKAQEALLSALEASLRRAVLASGAGRHALDRAGRAPAAFASHSGARGARASRVRPQGSLLARPRGNRGGRRRAARRDRRRVPAGRTPGAGPARRERRKPEPAREDRLADRARQTIAFPHPAPSCTGRGNEPFSRRGKGGDEGSSARRHRIRGRERVGEKLVFG